VSDALHLERLSGWLKTHAKNAYGRERLKGEPHSHGLELERRMDAAQAWTQQLSSDEGPDLGLDGDCRPALQHLTRDGILTGEDLHGISRLLEVLCTLHKDSESYPAALRGLTSALGAYDDEWERLRVSVGDEGALLDTASSELGDLRHKRDAARRRHAELADQLKVELDADGHLQDRYVTQRDDRHVLPVKASAKRQFGGVIHDSSRSGKTAYVEPAALLHAGQAVRETEEAVRQEEHRILVRLSQIIGHRTREIQADIDVLATLDADRTRGLFALTFNGVVPQFRQGEVTLCALRAPALLLAEVDPVVPVDLALSDEASVLVISGPNGGGKSVALTAAGWAFELAQRGIPLPAQSAVLPPPPYTLWPVVGDAADDRTAHSTFSGHLSALKSALEGATDAHHVVLVDEIASGTEPVAGSAIACGFLETFADTNAWVISTTHYDPVKHLALEHQKMRAAAVRDRRDQRVAYRLFADEVGGSHPIKLAIDLGLPSRVVERARTHLDPQRRARLDQLKKQQNEAGDIERARQDLQRDQEALKNEQAILEQAQRKWTKEQQKTLAKQHKEKALLENLKRERLSAVDELRNQLSETIKNLRNEGQLEAAKVGDRLFDEVKHLRQETHAIRLDDDTKDPTATVDIGDTVHLFAGARTGQIQEFRGKTALVVVDGKVFHVRREQLTLAPSGQGAAKTRAKQGKKKSQVNTIPLTETNTPQLDLRGLRAHEAEARIDRFLQRLCDLDGPGRIIHGIGTGAVRQATLTYLERGPWSVTHRSGLSSEGGDGVTVVILEG
jgi:DNA mismatch repair protein MutS2